MKVTYVLPEPERSGGNLVALLHAELLERAGHSVTVMALGGRPSWTGFGGSFLDYRPQLPELEPQDLIVATFWTTIETAITLDRGPVAHFCQGYEGGLEHLRPQLPEIEAAYSQDLPTLAVAPHLLDEIGQRFGRHGRVVPPLVHPAFRPGVRLRPAREPRIIVSGLFESAVKAIPVALEAVKLLRQSGVRCRLVRISMLPLGQLERSLLEPDRYLFDVPFEQVAAELRRSDLLLFSSQPEEGFGLPLLEAMASKLPAIASRIPSTEFMALRGVALVEPGDPAAFAAAARRVLAHRRRWQEARRLGFAESRRFVPRAVLAALQDALAWAAAYR